MSAISSNLASEKYGYDFVVATTQAAINATMKEYMSGMTEPEVVMCYVADADGNPAAIDYNTLVSNANGTDPFSIPADTAMSDSRFTDLQNARFMFGFKAEIGLPPGILPANMPDIVSLQGGTSAVKYNLLCSEFIVVQYTPGGGYSSSASWMNQSQPNGTAWIFTSNVDLRMTDVDSSAYSTLPEDMQKQIKNMGGNAFSVQQLLFDLDNAALQTQPTISGVEPGTSLYTALSNYFTGAYFTTMQQNGQPMLGATISQSKFNKSTLKMSDLNIEVNPFLGTSGSAVTNPTAAQADLYTLDYLCAVNGHDLPPAAQFGWNWLDESQSADYHGAIAIKSTTFIDWLNKLLSSDLDQICKQPDVDCYAKGLNVYYSLDFDDVTTPQSYTAVSGASPDSDGFTHVLTFSYSASDSDAGGTEGLVWGNLKCTYSSSSDVYFSDNQIKIKSHVNAWIHVNAEGGVTEGNFATYDSVTIYDLSVTDSGKLKAKTTGAVLTDNSQKINTNGWSQFMTLGTVDNVIDGEKEYTKETLSGFLDGFSSNITNCLNSPLAWVFPGGQTFTFQKVQFSNSLDLISYITYADPSSSSQNLLMASTSENHTITYSTELMKNYHQAEIMSPEANFEALQTSAGHSLLFSIGTDGVFYVTRELTGHATGWEKTDLSSALAASDLTGKTAVCNLFDVAQNAADGSIGVAMALSESSNDHLYLMLEQSAVDTSWLASPDWQSYPYDNPTHSLSAVKIVNVFMAETMGQQYIVADVLRDPADTTQQLIARYYIDPDKSDGYAWHVHNLSIDLESTGYASCLGQRKGQYVDGLYTFGKVGNDAQFIYQPLYNVWNPSIPASPSRLSLPNNLEPDAMAACRNSDNSTDLYVAASGGLYYFASSNQGDGAAGKLLFSNDVFNNVRKLYVFSSGGDIIVWGLNGADEIFYTSCAAGSVATNSAWSYPLPILTQVDLVSPYVNRVNNGNTFFAVAGNELTKAVQTPNKAAWKSQKITLPVLETTAAAQKFSSYTTQIQLLDSDEQPVANTAVSLSSLARTNVYINHLYYILDTTPIEVETDSLGQITIVEWVDGLQGSQIIVTGADGSQVQINPMDKPFNKVAQLTTADDLKDATITNDDGSTRPLVSSDTSDGDLETVASGNANLAAAYADVDSPGSSDALRLAAALPPATTLLMSSNPIEVAASDLFNWLASGVESVIEIVKDAASDAWHFIATIAGQAYKAVLDTVEAVVGAVEWVFNAIKTAIEDLIEFLEFLFGWADITRTKKVLKNLFELYIQEQLGQIKELEAQFDGKIGDLEDAINSWAGIDDWSDLGDAASQPASGSSTPSSGSSASSSHLSHHFQNNANNVTQTDPPAAPDPSQQLINDLLQAIEDEADTIDKVFTELQELAADFSSLSFGDVLKRLTAILADGVLDTIENVVDALFNLIYDVAEAAFKVLDTPIHIPIISDILNDIGIPDLSMLDLFCWISAVPVTLVYKVVHGEAPFPDNDSTDFLINATSFADVVQAFQPEQAMLMTNAASGPIPMSDTAGTQVFVLGHSGSGFFTLLSAIVDSYEAAEPSPVEQASQDAGFSFGIPSALLGVLSGVSVAVANILVPKEPMENEAANDVSIATAILRIVAKVVFSGAAQNKFGALKALNFMKKGDGRATGAVVDAVLTLPGLICTSQHLSELSAKPASLARSQAIIDETANVASYLARIMYCVAVNVDDEDEKAVAIGVMAVSDVIYGGLEVAEALTA